MSGRTPPRPLDPVRSIKVKLGVVVVGAVTATVAALYGSLLFGLQARFAFAAGLVVALGVIQLLAHGIVLPLREMAAASAAMAGGDYGRRVTATSQDEVGELARSFNALAESLAEAHRQRRNLVANVSHELRTPIASLQARLENVADGIEVIDQRGAESMLAAVGRLARLVEQLLCLAQFDAGEARLDPRRFIVADLVAGAMDEVEPVQPLVKMVVDVDPGLEGFADVEALHQALTNVLANACAHSPPAGVVCIDASSDGHHLTLRVRDHGVGIPAAEAERVFERFHRLDPARSGRDGTGLGLAIARSIVESHGGRIRAVPPPSGGCQIVIDLPI
jgi:signal transduction histidine kinase